jgi:hypothetical protein
MVPTAPQQPPTEEERAVSRNITEVPDPDAGTVVHFDPALALWDRVRGAWRWETYEAPPEYTLVHVVERATFTLSVDGTGLFVKPGSYPTSTRLYDVATGELRASRPGDHPSASA